MACHRRAAHPLHKGSAPVRAKWDLLRFTWPDRTTRPEYVLGEIRAALGSRSAIP